MEFHLVQIYLALYAFNDILIIEHIFVYHWIY